MLHPVSPLDFYNQTWNGCTLVQAGLNAVNVPCKEPPIRKPRQATFGATATWQGQGQELCAAPCQVP